MFDRTALILLDSKPNRVSLNALVGALETDPQFDSVELRLAANEPQVEQHVAEVLAAGKCAVVGVSFRTRQLERIREWMLRRASQAARPWRERGRVLWVAGGPHPTAAPQETLQLGFDVVVCGEGEAALLDLLQATAARGDFRTIPGIAFVDERGEGQFTQRRAAIDLDRFPPFPLVRRRVVGPIEITRGCPFACGFCQTSHLQGLGPRHRSIPIIVRYAGEIRRRQLRDVRFVAPNAFSYGSPDGRALNVAALESLLAALREAVGPEGRLFFGTFPSEVRPEHVTDATLALVKRFANNDTLIIGAQSGSPATLQRCRRGHSVEDILAAVSRTAAAGLKPQVDFIFGLPDETAEDLQATLGVIQRLGEMGAVIQAHPFTPLPQTRFADAPPGQLPASLGNASIARFILHRPSGAPVSSGPPRPPARS